MVLPAGRLVNITFIYSNLLFVHRKSCDKLLIRDKLLILNFSLNDFKSSVSIQSVVQFLKPNGALYIHNLRHFSFAPVPQVILIETSDCLVVLIDSSVRSQPLHLAQEQQIDDFILEVI